MGATWAKGDITFQLRALGSPDTGAHTVVMQPLDQSYPTGAITCTHYGDGWYSPDYDLDDETHYHIYVDGVFKKLWIAKKSSPALTI